MDTVTYLGGVARRIPRLRDVIAERDYLRRRNAEICLENERLRGAPRSDGAGLKYLFVVTYGRSGSTLLQGILNTIPGYLIRGENRGLMGDLYKFHQRAVKDREQRRKAEPIPVTHPWFGIDGYPDDVALSGMRELALSTFIRPENDSRVVGYKEIRWPQNDLPEFIDYLRSVFPGARFVVNTRSLEEVSRSKWWADKPNAIAELKATEERFLALAENIGDAAFRVHFDDYVANPSNLSSLFDWLGEEFDEKGIRKTMEQRHSY
ncbi:sulfotransferase [Arthrobacter monumenti]